MRRNNKGFSLLELLVVIGMIGIMAAIAIPNFTGFVRKNRVANQTKRLYNDILNARVMAMNRNMTHFVVFAGNQYSVIADTNDSLALDASPTDTKVLVRSNADLVPSSYFNTVPQGDIMNNNLGGQITINARGIASPSGTICVANTTFTIQPSCNCIVVNPVQIRMGKLKIGDACDADHCQEIQ